MPNFSPEKNPKEEATFKQLVAEIRNRTFAEAYLAIKDCITQKEFSKRVGVDETKFSRVLSKIEKEKGVSPATV